MMTRRLFIDANEILWETFDYTSKKPKTKDLYRVERPETLVTDPPVLPVIELLPVPW